MARSFFHSARTIAIWFAVLISVSAEAQQQSCDAIFIAPARPILSLAVKKLDVAAREEARVLPQPARDYKNVEARENPLLDYKTLPFDAVDFTKLKPEHFVPALDLAVAQSKIRLAEIRENPEPPTFENTIEALEMFDAPVERVSKTLYHLQGVKGTDALRDIAKVLFAKSQKLDALMSGDTKLRDRVDEFIKANAGMKVTKEQNRLISRIRSQFDQPGENKEARQKIDEINTRLNALTSEFGSSLTKDRATFRFKMTDAKNLEGLSESLIARAKERAVAEGSPEAWSFVVGEIDSILANSKIETVRKKAWIQKARIGQKRSNSDNRATVLEIAKLREERAKVAGMANAATLRMRGRMARNPETATNFLLDLAEKYRPGAIKEKEELDRFAGHEVKPWDMPYYVSKLKAEQLGYNEKEVREYFPLKQVLKGFFFTAQKLYGVTFTARLDIPTWDPSVMVYEVKDREGNHVGLIYLDYFERPGEKRAGAWATSLESSGLLDGAHQRPLVVNVTNFKKPAPGEPALLSVDQVTTLFHEGGHGLHQLLSKTRYRTFSGTQVAWDFVELPSQFMENFAFQKEVLDVYARHYKTGQALSPAIVEQVQKSQNFRAATSGLSQVKAALLDMAWHTRDLTNLADPRDVAKFERAAVAPFELSKAYGALQSTTFSHVFSGGYDAGYYSYKWADVLASDAFEAFKEHGIFNVEVASKMQKNILERGGTQPADELYRNFRGRDADPAALLRREGVLPPLPAAAKQDDPAA